MSLVQVPNGVFHMELANDSLFFSHTYKYLGQACNETRPFYLSNLATQWCCVLCGVDEFGFLPQEDENCTVLRKQFRIQQAIWQPQQTRLLSKVFSCECKGVVHQRCLENFLQTYLYWWCPGCKCRMAIHHTKHYPHGDKLYEPTVLEIQPIKCQYTFYPNPEWYELKYQGHPTTDSTVLWYLKTFLPTDQADSLQMALEEEELQEVASYFNFNCEEDLPSEISTAAPSPTSFADRDHPNDWRPTDEIDIFESFKEENALPNEEEFASEKVRYEGL